jgi:peptidoglycan/xylan/chitin deacetylase (PgdA/CDA1 family)
MGSEVKPLARKSEATLRYGALVWMVASLFWLGGCSRGGSVSAAPASATTPSPALELTPTAMTYTASSAQMQPALPSLSPATAVVERAATSTPHPVSLAGLLPTPTPTLAATSQPTYAPTPDGVARSLRVPILMYHYLSTPPDDADIYRRDLSVSPELFAAQLDRLLAEGYTAVNLYQVIDALQRGAPLPEKPVVITFDDGYRDNYENAFPLLHARNMPATLFVVTDFIDEQRPDYLTWDMARTMLAAGISIESHSRNHASLADQGDDYLVWQLLGSLETIEYELGVRPRFLSYPAGDYDQRTIDIARSANYWAAATTKQGALLNSDHPFELSRIRVRNTTDPDDLIRLLALDW